MFDKEVYSSDVDYDNDITLIPFNNQNIIDELHSVIKTNQEVFNITTNQIGLNFSGRLGKQTVRLSYILTVRDSLRSDTEHTLIKALAKTLDLFIATHSELDKIMLDFHMGDLTRESYTGILPDMTLAIELEHPTGINSTPFITAKVKSYTVLTSNYTNNLITIKAQKMTSILQAIDDNILSKVCSKLKLTT